MASILRPIYTHAILLMIIAHNEILFAEGRWLGAMERDENSPMQYKKETRRHGSRAVNLHQNPGGHGRAYDLPVPRTTHAPIVDHSVMIRKKDIPPTVTLGQNHAFHVSSAVSKHDLTPTTRGNSPGNSTGVGHSLVGQNDDVQGNLKGNGSTAQGHSPGVGHSLVGQNDDVQGNLQTNGSAQGHSPGVGHSWVGQNYDVQGNLQSNGTTVQGHSPGVGHSFQENNRVRSP